VGCGWVDATGNQGGSSSASVNNGSSTLGNGVLTDQGVVVVNENTTTRLALADAPSGANGWSWRAVTISNAVTMCNSVDDFDAAIAVTQLNRACTDESDCNFLIQEFDNNGRTEFDVTLPVLKAPVELNFSLETTLDSGEQHTQEQTLCALAINEAPDVIDNRYRTVTTETREVSANANDSIFSNDSDDEHIRNQPLFIKEVTSAPRYAENISINSDGSFRYKALETLDLSDGESLEDRINLIISDGVHDVESAITMNIVTSNVSPTLQQRVPDFTLTPTDRAPAELSANLAQYFNDADGDELQYQLVNNELSNAGLLSIDEEGNLTGRFSMVNIGAVSVTVLVSDGLAQVADRFNVIVQESLPTNQLPNQDPSVTDIRNQSVSGLFSYDVSVFFTDPDGDTLTFTSDNLPPGVNLSNDGLLTGSANAENDGRWFITITASDNRGGAVDDSFRLVIDL